MPKTIFNLGLTILAATLALSAAEPGLGTWKLNTAKSKFSPGRPVPKSSTTVFSREGDWIVQKTDGIDAEGKPTNYSNRYKLDGGKYPFKVPGLASGAITVTRIDDYNYEWVFTGEGGGQVKGRTVISKDGKTRTQTSTGVDPQGRKIDSVQVSDRQ
jgi:hypothetical protein